LVISNTALNLKNVTTVVAGRRRNKGKRPRGVVVEIAGPGLQQEIRIKFLTFKFITTFMQICRKVSGIYYFESIEFLKK